MSKYDDLVRKLKEIFQIDKPELDFGVYRILNVRAAEINKYLDNGLKNKVARSLAVAGAGNLETLQKELAEKEAQYKGDGLDPDNVPKVKELKQKIAELGSGSAEHANAVFTHLLTFFSRYYDKGDFISQRRYKGDTYAIPSSGEEIIFNWANKEQYYTKSGENFSNYAFKLDDGRLIRFRLVAADTAKGNQNETDKDRLFALAQAGVRTFIDESGDEYEEHISPIEPFDSELVIRFEYKSFTKGVKQDDLVENAVKKIFEEQVVQARWTELARREPTESNPKRTLLEKCLSSYVLKNTADYFIHKNLNGFLARELDFYIKNEVMQLDDIQDVGAFSNIEKSLRTIQTLRAISLDIISFLSQLEDFQKTLWLKKKFVVSTNYCVTLDRVHKSLYEQIVNNKKQWSNWVKLGLIDEAVTKKLNSTEKKIEYLKSHNGLMLDTSIFDVQFKYSLLANFSDVDAEVDGLLVNGDNFQALNLCSEWLKGKVDFVYIDPPYNTVHSKIIYKNKFEHASWLSLINNTLPTVSSILGKDYSFGFAIDDYEYNNAFMLLREHFTDCDVSTIVINHHPQGSGGRISRTHEYYIVASPLGGAQYLGRPKPDETEDRSFMRSGTADNNYRAPRGGGVGRWRSFYALLVDQNTNKVVGVEPPPPLGVDYPTGPTENGLKRVYPINASGEERVWRSSYETGKLRVQNSEIVITDRGAVKQLIDHQDKRETLFSNWIGADFNAGTNGTAILDSMGLGGQFDYPKSVKTLEQSFWMQSFGKKNFTVLDYFAGSGTTGHAVISLNRQDGAKRKYVLVEQGQYFDTVLQPRIQKAVYSPGWTAGKPDSHSDGVSQLVKVVKIESYEDTLNNLSLSRSQAQQSLLNSLPQSGREDYLLRYMLDVESRGSLLSVDQFKKPFDCKLKVTVDSAGAYEERTIDLVETFNYLVGLRVKHVDMQLNMGFVSVTGVLPSGEKALVLWRDAEKLDYDRLNRLCEKLAINPADSEFDVVYINGDHNIPAAFTSTEAEGGITKTLKIRQIEPEFISRMFNTEG
jgi:adenine-specific DNA-methyltransferase